MNFLQLIYNSLIFICIDVIDVCNYSINLHHHSIPLFLFTIPSTSRIVGKFVEELWEVLYFCDRLLQVVVLGLSIRKYIQTIIPQQINFSLPTHPKLYLFRVYCQGISVKASRRGHWSRMLGVPRDQCHEPVHTPPWPHESFSWVHHGPSGLETSRQICGGIMVCIYFLIDNPSTTTWSNLTLLTTADWCI